MRQGRATFGTRRGRVGGAVRAPATAIEAAPGGDAAGAGLDWRDRRPGGAPGPRGTACASPRSGGHLPARLALALVAGLFLFAPLPRDASGADAAAARGSAAAGRRPEVEVSGLGWWRNREMRKSLELLESDDEPLRRIDAAYVEDGVVILQSALERDGYLRPAGEVVVRSGKEVVGRYPWTTGDVPAPPRDLDGNRVDFRLEPGVRYRFAGLEFRGLTAASEKEARGFFIETGFLLTTGGARRFTPAILQRGLGNLREHLVRMGYAEARAEVASEERNDDRGTVRVVIQVTEGPVHRVRVLHPPAEAPEDVADGLRKLCAESAGAVWSPLWQQDILQAARSVCYARGYARAEADLVRLSDEEAAGGVSLEYRLDVETGPKIRVGRVQFAGDDRTRRSVLQRLVDVDPGDLFVRSEVERDRLKLGGLGVHRSVRAEVDHVAPDLWDLTYRLTPGKQLEASLLAGYGSYERFRAGLEVFHANLFRRAHRGRLQLVQSMKSSSADYVYSLPQVFGTVTDASIRLFGLAREEVSFDREEFGASIGLRRHLEALGADAALRYQFESVSADVFGGLPSVEAPVDSRVASLTFDITRDRRDNPLMPRRGSLVALTLETAATAIGGQVDYQRIELSGSWHRTIGDGRYVHVGLRHGVLLGLGSSEENIPFGKRFFPGGEDTIRGFREGRAAPRNEDRLVIGAEASTIVNLEIEQALIRSLSVVGFLDVGLTGADLGDWPGDQWRVSAGVGLRYNTIIGPARLEYGHNIVKETGDQVGELHFALGFPF